MPRTLKPIFTSFLSRVLEHDDQENWLGPIASVDELSVN